MVLQARGSGRGWAIPGRATRGPARPGSARMAAARATGRYEAERTTAPPRGRGREAVVRAPSVEERLDLGVGRAQRRLDLRVGQPDRLQAPVQDVLDGGEGGGPLDVAGDLDGARVLVAVRQRAVLLAGQDALADRQVTGAGPVDRCVVDPGEQLKRGLEAVGRAALERRGNDPHVAVGPGGGLVEQG